MTPKWDPNPGLLRLGHLTNPSYLSARLRESSRAGQAASRVINAGLAASGFVEGAYRSIRGRWKRKVERVREDAARAVEPRETPFRLRKLLNPFFLARRERGEE